jgi:hypothetical protein
VKRALLLALMLVVLVGIAVARPVKPDGQAEELERVRTELRLRTGELIVVRGQLRACESRTR